MVLSSPVMHSHASVLPADYKPNKPLVTSDASKAFFYCALLALQFGLQPLLASSFTDPIVAKSSVVISTEVCKILIGAASLLAEKRQVLESIGNDWSLADSLKVAALPATLYAIQNLMIQYGYQLLDSMSFNLINQTKTLSAALWLYVMMGQRQSPVQMFALLLLLGAAVTLNAKGLSGSAGVDLADKSYSLGVAVVLGASMLSGLSSALTQRVLVSAKPRHPLFFSAELAVYGIVFLLLNAALRDGGILGRDFFRGWTPLTLIPVVSNALGGLVVGYVTKYAGGVLKGFALIAGIILTGFVQWAFEGKPLGANTWVAVALVSVSIYLHASYPAPKSKPIVTRQKSV